MVYTFPLSSLNAPISPSMWWEPRRSVEDTIHYGSNGFSTGKRRKHVYGCCDIDDGTDRAVIAASYNHTIGFPLLLTYDS